MEALSYSVKHIPRETQYSHLVSHQVIQSTHSPPSISDSRSVLMSWLVPCCRSGAPLASGFGLGEAWGWGGGCGNGADGGCASCSPSLLELSSPLAESDEELLPLLLICSMTSTSARSSANSEPSQGEGGRERQSARASIRTNF